MQKVEPWSSRWVEQRLAHGATFGESIWEKEAIGLTQRGIGVHDAHALGDNTAPNATGVIEGPDGFRVEDATGIVLKALHP